MGDLIAIMKDGQLVQYDTPDRMLAAPQDEFVAEFVGADRGAEAPRAGHRRGSGRAVAGARRIAPHRVRHDASRRALDPAHGGGRRSRGRRRRRCEPRVPDARGDPRSARGPARSARRRIALRLGLGGLIEQNPIGVRAWRRKAREPQLRKHAGHAGIHRAVDERSAKPVDRSGVGRRGSDEERHRRRRGRFRRCAAAMRSAARTVSEAHDNRNRADRRRFRPPARLSITRRGVTSGPTRLPVERRPPRDAQQVVPDRVVARLRMLDRPADAAAERVAQARERPSAAR